MPNFNANNQQNLTAAQVTPVYRNGSLVATRRGINIVPSSNVTIAATDNSASDRVDLTFSATGGSGGGSVTRALMNIKDTGYVEGSYGDAGAPITAALATYKGVELNPGVTYQGWTPILVPTIGGRLYGWGHCFINFPVPGSLWQSSTWDERDGLIRFSESSGAQGWGLAEVRGLVLSGQIGQSATALTKTTGINMGSYQDWDGVGEWDGSPCHVRVSDCIITAMNIGIMVPVAQYYNIEYVTITNSNIGIYHTADSYDGGGIDMPEMRFHNLWSNKVGMIFQTAGIFNVGNYRVHGAWVKDYQGLGGAGVMFCHDPLYGVSGSSPYNEVVLDHIGFEYTAGGRCDSPSATFRNEFNSVTVECRRYVRNGPDVFYDREFPCVEIWIEGNYVVKLEGGQFGDDNSRCCALLSGPGSVLHFGEGSICPSQSGYWARCHHKDAHVYMTWAPDGGTVENVVQFPNKLTFGVAGRDDQRDTCGIMTGTQLTEVSSTAPSSLHSSFFTTGTHPYGPQAPTFSAGTANVTVGHETITDEGLSQEVSYFTFANGAGFSDRAYLPYLSGGSSQASVSSMWATCFIELYNTTANEVRLKVGLENGSGLVVGHPQNQRPGWNAGAPYGPYPHEAITLWPGQWQRVQFMFCRGEDLRPVFRLHSSSGAGPTKIRARRLGYYRAPVAQRGTFNQVMHHGKVRQA